MPEKSGIFFFIATYKHIQFYLCAMKNVRVRFAPSPTGGLHLGGVRTVLYNYLFARQHQGKFVLRIEDTDQTRFVEGAEQYIFDCLQWCGLTPDESSLHGGPFAPYRQSERKDLYKKYADQLVKEGHAYYAFDTPDELEAMRENLKAAGSNSLQYDHAVRMKMKNSLNLSEAETTQMIDNGVPYVIRIKVEPGHTITFNDMIRGEVHFESNTVDDKVLMKADGMPTYHLAVVVDDFLMEISHAFRGEEWLPSAPVHILLWKYLFGEDKMPLWAHLPLILKPDGHGKLSKRDGDALGFPVFAMNWKDKNSGEITKGFKETGFLPEAFVNMLAVLGWNDGTEQEVFSLEELIEKFSIDRVHKGGARFDFEKAKWYNHEWIKRSSTEKLFPLVKEVFTEKGIVTDDTLLETIIPLIKDRCTLTSDFYQQGIYFFQSPAEWDLAAISKWDENKKTFFVSLIEKMEAIEWNMGHIEIMFKELAAEKGIKPGELQLPMRIMLVGGKFGPTVFHIAEIIGRKETISRIQNVLQKM